RTSALDEVEDVIKELPIWPEEAHHIQHDGRLWRMRDSRPDQSLVVQSSRDAWSPKAFLALEQAFLADGGHWVHQAEFLVAARGSTELQLVLPKAASLLALTLDDQLLIPLAAAGQTYRIALTGPPRPRALRAYWRFLPEAESIRRPLLGGAYL